MPASGSEPIWLFYRIWVWNTIILPGGYRVVVVDPELVKLVTVKNAHKFKRSDFVAKAVPSSSKGLFSANGKVHARQKRMISPAFSVSNLKGFVEVFQENTEKLVEVIGIKWLFSYFEVFICVHNKLVLFPYLIISLSVNKIYFVLVVLDKQITQLQKER